jgi:hypothetical protein
MAMYASFYIKIKDVTIIKSVITYTHCYLQIYNYCYDSKKKKKKLKESPKYFKTIYLKLLENPVSISLR